MILDMSFENIELNKCPQLVCFVKYLSKYFGEIAPPHFHALYAEYEVLIDIQTLEVIRSSMPRRALARVLEWSFQHRAELLDDWTLCKQNQSPKKYFLWNSMYCSMATNESQTLAKF